MAHSTAMNSLTEALVASILPANGKDPVRVRKAKENFARTLKHHNFARTNQFEVAERLKGVEEKFQILNFDDLSDALYACLKELKTYENQWLPDALDLLLHLSSDPTSRIHSEALKHVKQRDDSPAPLKWSEIEADDPIDRNDPIWHIQDYSDLSSDEDVYDVPSESSSPKIAKGQNQGVSAFGKGDSLFIPVDDNYGPEFLKGLKEAQISKSLAEPSAITEQQAIREALFMLQGLPTTLFERSGNVIAPSRDFKLHHLSTEIFEKVLNAFAQLGQRTEIIRQWLEKPQQLQYMQRMRVSIEYIVTKFDAAIAVMQANLLNPKEAIIVSLAKVLDDVEEEASVVVGMYKLVRQLETGQKVRHHPLDVLFETVCLSQACDNRETSAVAEVFATAFDAYMKPIIKWVTTGRIDSWLDPFFVANGNKENRSRLWNDWVIPAEKSDEFRPPRFMKVFVQQIFTCGKTVLFLHTLNTSQTVNVEQIKFELSISAVQHSVLSRGMPFREVLGAAISSAISSCLSYASRLLQHELGQTCGLWTTLDALDLVYFAKCGHVTESIDSKIFGRIDRCDNGWNDRFLVVDLIEDKFSATGGVEIERLAIHARYTSSRNMESRRQSVKILEDLSVEYVLPWALANIISQSALGSYRRVALLLAQIRRAKHALLRKAHFFVHSGLLHIDAGDRKHAQTLHHSLLLFVDILYGHLTSLVIEQSTRQMRLALKEAADVEEMIKSFDSYASRLEEACLTVKKLKVVRDALISMLDLCIRFSDVVSAPAGPQQSDFEASSFKSARSRHRKGNRRRSDAQDTSSDEDEETDQGDGYSSFVVLENGSPVDEIRKIKNQFGRHLSFIVAALRGLGKSGSQGMSWEVLAERLDWKQ